jgi:hypothetical protein
LDVLIDASLYQTKCYGYVSPRAKAALNRLGDIFNIKLSNEIDAEKAIGRMAKRSLDRAASCGARRVLRPREA